MLTTESLPKHVEGTAEYISRAGVARLSHQVPETYVEKVATDIVQQDQQLECVSEEEISTTVCEGKMTFHPVLGLDQYTSPGVIT